MIYCSSKDLLWSSKDLLKGINDPKSYSEPHVHIILWSFKALALIQLPWVSFLLSEPTKTKTAILFQSNGQGRPVSSLFAFRECSRRKLYYILCDNKKDYVYHSSFPVLLCSEKTGTICRYQVKGRQAYKSPTFYPSIFPDSNWFLLKKFL